MTYYGLYYHTQILSKAFSTPSVCPHTGTVVTVSRDVVMHTRRLSARDHKLFTVSFHDVFTLTSEEWQEEKGLSQTPAHSRWSLFTAPRALSGSLGSRQALWQWSTPSSGLHDILDQACRLKTWARGLMSEVKALPMMHRSFSGVITADKIGIHDVLPYLENLTLRFGNLITSCSLQYTQTQFLSLFLHASK